jgi:hypothetical protein
MLKRLNIFGVPSSGHESPGNVSRQLRAPVAAAARIGDLLADSVADRPRLPLLPPWRALGHQQLAVVLDRDRDPDRPPDLRLAVLANPAEPMFSDPCPRAARLPALRRGIHGLPGRPLRRRAVARHRLSHLACGQSRRTQVARRNCRGSCRLSDLLCRPFLHHQSHHGCRPFRRALPAATPRDAGHLSLHPERNVHLRHDGALPTGPLVLVASGAGGGGLRPPLHLGPLLYDREARQAAHLREPMFRGDR